MESKSEDKKIFIYFAHDDAVALLCKQHLSSSGEASEGEDSTTPALLGKWRFGGAEAQLIDIAKGLSTRSECNVIFLTQYKDLEFIDDGIEVRYFPLDALSTQSMVLSLQDKERLEQLRIKDIQSIFIQTIATPNVALWREAAHLIGADFVYRVSSDLDIDGSLFGDSHQKERYLKALKEADLVVVQSERQKDLLAQKHKIESTLIRKGIYAPKTVNGSKKIDVLWAGRACSIKRPWLFLSFARAYPELGCVMLLAKDEDVLERTLLFEAKTIPNLEIMRDVSYSKTWNYFATSRVFMGTSFIEGGLPVVYLQAFAYGIPVCSYSVDFEDRELKELNYFGDSDWTQFVHKIKNLLDKPDQLNKTKFKLKEYFARNHSMDACIAAYLDAFDRIRGRDTK